jgi:uncharacterized protein (TIGR00369 family)
MTPLPVPDGFERHFRQSPLTAPWEPLYSKRTTEAIIIGVRLAEPHTNSRGMVHGGLIATLADNAMGLSCGLKLKDGSRLLTINLNVDFLGTAKPGQWLEVDTAFVKAGGTICFAQCLVTADGAPCARANATFRVIAAAAAT